MNLKVNYSELSQLGTDILNEDDKLYRVLERTATTIEKVGNYWSGKDSELFVEKGTKYIEEQQKERGKIQLLGIMLEKISGKYKDSDFEWEKSIKKLGEQNNDKY